MNTKLLFNQTGLYQILFSICVIIPFFNNYELSFITWGMAILLTLKKNYSLEFIKYWLIFVVIFFIAIVTSVFFDHQTYFFIRDITYILKPICGLLLGYQLFNKYFENPYRILVYAGLSIAVYHLLLVFIGIVFYGARTVAVIREHGGYFNDFEVYTFIILVFHKQFSLGFSKQKTRYFIVIMALSSFFYLARTNFIQMVVLSLALKGFFILNKKSIIIVLGTLFLALSGYAAVYYYNPVRNGKGLDEFLYKIKMIPAEAFSTKINRHDWKDFNDNYRSYENIRTLEQLSRQENLWFGQGLGSKVNLKQKIYLGDMQLQYISILHNGYMTVLLKAGLAGLFIYLISIFLLFKNSFVENKKLQLLNRLFIGTGVFLIISNWVFMGFYNPVDTKTLLIGFLFAYKNQILKANA